MKRTPSRDDSIHNIVQRLDLALGQGASRIVTFISARPGEGVSTVARDYAHALSELVDHQILLIDAGSLDDGYFQRHGADPAINIADTLAAGKPLADALRPVSQHIAMGRWASLGRGRSAAAKLLNDGAFWKMLTQTYGTVVIDAPSLKESADGIALAARADAAVIVVEAEATRQPVIENLRDALRAAGAKIAGVIMNKRRFYIPASVYKNM